MNKNELLERLNEFCNIKEIDLSDIWLTSGAALVMHGLRETTNDIDFGCIQPVWSKIKNNSSESRQRRILIPYVVPVIVLKFDEKITCHVTRIKPANHLLNIIDGIHVDTLEVILIYKEKLNREKDKDDILLITNYLKGINP